MSKWSWKEYSQQNPCPICGKKKWCSYVGDLIRCHRSPHNPNIVITIGGKTYISRHSKGAMLYIPYGGWMKTRMTVTKTEDIQFDVDKLHDIYSDILNHLTLSNEHKEFARAQWGLDVESLSVLSFKSNDPVEIGAVLAKISHQRGVEYLNDVPGISVRHGRVTWSNRSNAILIPLYDSDGRCTSLQLRQVDPSNKCKYLLLSGARKQVSTYGMIKNDDAFFGNSLVLTEGVSKAYVATQELPAIRGMGLTGYGKALDSNVFEVILQLKEENLIDNVVLAFDQDSDEVNRKNVERVTLSLAEALFACNLDVYIAKWESEHKGVDDAIRAGVQIILSRYEPTVHKIKLPIQEQIKTAENYLNNYRMSQSNTMEIEHASQLVRHFLSDWTSNGACHLRVLASDAGVGKTTAMRDICLDANLDGRTLIAFENYDKLNEFYAPIGKCDYVGIYRGRNEENCKMSDKAKELGEKGHNVEIHLCKQCPYADNCTYLAQFDTLKKKKVVLGVHQSVASVLSVNDVHEYSREPRMGIFNYVIIDENPIKSLYNKRIMSRMELHDYVLRLKTRFTELSSVSKTHQNKIKSAIDFIENIESFLDEMVIQQRREMGVQNIIQSLLLRMGKSEILEGTSYLLGTVDKFLCSDLEKPTSENIPQKGLYELCTSIENTLKGIEHYDTLMVARVCNHKAEIVLSTRNSPLVKYLSNNGAIILDATANRDYWARICSHAGTIQPPSAITLRVTHPAKTRIVFMDGLAKSMESQSEPFAKNNMREFLGNIRILHGNESKIGAIVTKSMHKFIGDDFENVKVGHFGRDHRGSNEFQDVDVLVVGGYAENVFEKSIEFQTMTGERFTIESRPAYKRNLSGHLVRKHVSNHEGFQQFYEHSQKAELYQAIHRTRLLRRQDDDITIYYTGDPLLWDENLPLVNDFKEFVSSAKRNQAKPLVQRKILEKSTNLRNLFAYVFERGVKTAKEFKKWLLTVDYKVREGIARKIGVSVKTVSRHLNDDEFLAFFAQYRKQNSEVGRKETDFNCLERTLVTVLDLFATLKQIGQSPQEYWLKEFIFG